MAIQIQIRRGTSSEWSTSNPILAQGEVGYELNTGKAKVGDGLTAWNSLGYFNPNNSVTSVAMTTPTGLQVSGSPITTSGTLALTYASGYSIPTTASQTNWDSAYSERRQWDGGSTNLVASTGRTSLGATTLGSNLFTITDPGAITFPRFNADNTVSALSASSFRTAIGAGTGDGTVTSVGATSPVASSGGATPTISLSSGYGDTQNPYASKTANFFLAAPDGSVGAPTFRAIVAADVPTLNQNTTGTASNVTGTVAIANGGTGETTRQAAMDALAGAVTAGQYLRGNGTDVVMSAIQVSDVPTLNQNTTGTASNVTGTVAVANGGTGQTSYTDGQLLIGNSTGNTLTKATLTQGSGITITNGSGSISIDNAAPMTYPGAGIPNSTGTAWGTSYSTTGSGTVVALATSPSFTTPSLGVATATTINKVTFTAPATGSTLTIADGKTLTVNNSITFSGTDATTMTLPTTNATLAGLAVAQTFTATQTFSQINFTVNTVTVSANAGTVPITHRLHTFTNSSAAAMTITLATASAVDGQMAIVRIFDFSAAAQTINWVNTENSTVTVPTTSNGSTTLPLTVGFMYNNATSKWRCVASA